MRILWAPNPLRTVIELDDSDKRWLRERIKVEHLQDRIDSAHFDLDPEMREWRATHGRDATIEDAVTRALASLDAGYNTGDEPRNGRTLDQYLDERTAHVIAALAEEHCGDCTCVPCSCSKCHAEGLLGVRTRAGLGKHEATKILAAFKAAEGEPDVSLDAAIEWLKNYRPVYRPNSNWPEDAWSLHVPRWIEEGQRAHEWLVAYQRERFPAMPPSSKDTEK